MSEAAADPANTSCYLLFSGTEIEEYQKLEPDLSSPSSAHAPSSACAHTRARDWRGRFAKGSSGNPRGRPPGIPNPKRRVVGLRAVRKSPDAVMALFDRKPHLLRQLTAQFLPPPARAIDPAERIGLDLSAIGNPDDAAGAMSTLLVATSRGKIAPAEAARIARRVRRRLRAIRRLERVQRRLARRAQETDPVLATARIR